MKVPLSVIPTERAAQENARSCGGCHACCVLPRIQAGLSVGLLVEGKAGYTPCPYLSSCGPQKPCSIYNDRPNVCAEFACLWRAGYITGDERRRPDNLGVMFTGEAVRGHIAVEAWELWEGALAGHPGRGVLDALSSRYVVLCRYYGVPASLRYQGPQSLIVGGVLSEWARDDPPRLANWLGLLVMRGELENPNQLEVERELAAMRGGETVSPHFGPKAPTSGR